MKCLGFARQSLLNHTSFPGGKKCTLQLKNHSGLDIDQEPINLFWEAFSLQLPWGRRGLPYYAIKKKKSIWVFAAVCCSFNSRIHPWPEA